MKLLSPKTQDSRPITDRVKESLFSVLYKYDLPNGKMVADLFCGVGSLGIEALSRGAQFVTFVENDPKIIAVLEKNIEKAGFVKESKVLRANAFKIGAPVDFIRRSLGEGGEQEYDLVFVDPPYSATKDVGKGSRLDGLLNLLSGQSAADLPSPAETGCVKAGGIVVVRTHRQTELLEQYGRFEVIERRLWGTMAVTILVRRRRIIGSS
jgi:16S rRNA (guanine(966)-N(2))-methyltransferase RsmD